MANITSVKVTVLRSVQAAYTDKKLVTDGIHTAWEQAMWVRDDNTLRPAGVYALQNAR